jgi:Domain of unknown function (DUF222)/HNH endonuclease
MLMRSLQQLGDEIAELSVHLDAATVRLLDLIREFDMREGWNNGFRSCAAWLAWRVGLDMGAARERVRVARALDGLPQLKAALTCGELSYAKVRALTRVATPATEDRLLAVGRAGTAQHVERIVRGWRRVDRQAEVEDTRQRHRHRALHVYQDVDGSVVIRGRLAPEAGAVLIQALAAACDVERGKPATFETNNVSAETRSFEQQQADALVLVAETALHHGIDPGTPGERYQVVVHVDAEVLADVESLGQSVIEGGGRVSAETSQRIACDASRVEMRHDVDGVIVEVGPRTRTIPTALRRALAYRDHGCRFPGCDLRFGQAHHIQHWAQGGPTTLSNLVLLCRRHHRAVHEEGFQVERGESGELQFRSPHGWVLAYVSPPSRMPDGAEAKVRAWNTSSGITIHPHTATPKWNGERLNLGWAIDALHPRANPL